MDKRVVIRRVDNGYIMEAGASQGEGGIELGESVYESVGDLLVALVEFFGERLSKWTVERLENYTDG